MTFDGTLPESPLRDSTPIDILLVEPDAEFAEMVAACLERDDGEFAVYIEANPDDAMAVIRDETTAVDCVVSGYDMPEMDGLDLLDAVRERDPDRPFILFTGEGSEALASKAISAGVTDYVRKRGGTEQCQALANRVRNAVERYRAEQYLDRGRQAIESAHDGISIIDRDGRIRYLNTAYAELFGYDRAELQGRHWELLYREDDLQKVYDVLLPEARSGRWSGRTEFVRKDGDVIDAEHTLTYTDGGWLVCTVAPPQDEQAEQHLSVKGRAMDEAPVGIVLTDPSAADNPIIYANDKFVDLTGYEKSEAIGRNCRFLQGERTREEPVRKLREAVEAREPATVELRNYRADGTEFWNRVRIAPVFGNDGDVELFVGFQSDVTTRKEREQQLRSSTARLEALFENSPDMIAIHDADGTIRDANRRMCEELGYARSELVGKSVWELDPTVDPDEARSFWNELPMQTPRRFNGELERKDDTTFPVEIHLIRVDLDGEDRFVAMDRDISDQQKRESRLVEQNQRLDRFTSVVSHDLRNPLNVAKGRLELLREDCDSDQIEDLDVALSRMDNMIDDLLTLAQEGERAMEIETLDVTTVVEACWETVATGDATLDTDIDATVDADRDQLQQLFENLIRNAVEHSSASPDSEHGGDTVTVTVGEIDRGFYVADDGPGIPEDERDDVFEAGYSTEAGGTGFGLSIVEQVVDAHDWTITVTESDDGGARFEIRTD
ncbi:PAS/PAC sensor hybrid histidine kinase [Natronoarchaeum philippinense]|uniref:histidine kinase n=1 Tax=Natronoarchaeum philippinense TaxID=558529 RepID=A0A285P625_NATPI|nr:PAS domain S-box protein [Natronoarchaeum philippinense]SNZ16898.1 PAS/PAC sensor hybrid histidine kinase [Natronoarchaeum philippinense]